MLIVLWGQRTEGPLAAVRTELQSLGANPILIDQDERLCPELRFSGGATLSGSIRAAESVFDLEEITAAYVRPYMVTSASAPGEGEMQLKRRAFESAFWSWLELTRALVINRAKAMASNGSKPYQLRHIQRVGFAVPETLITTDAAAVNAFVECHGDVIYKSVSGIRSIVRRLQAEQLKRINDISCCPTQFQEYIVGRDHRVHVVGDEVFACEVVTEADDYRYPGACPVEVCSCRLPPEIEDRCRRLARELELPVSGIDLRLTERGDWYCFEVNPSPAFTYYQQRTGQPIGQAIARLLMRGSMN